jgi:hypothetical protein
MHVGMVVVTICMPLVPHGIVTTQGIEVMVAAPHEEPSVFGRVQGCDSLVVATMHAPAWQVELITLRICVPLVAHAFAPGSQADHVPKTCEAHIVPSVLGRVHACESIVVDATHAPPVQ